MLEMQEGDDFISLLSLVVTRLREELTTKKILTKSRNNDNNYNIVPERLPMLGITSQIEQSDMYKVILKAYNLRQSMSNSYVYIVGTAWDEQNKGLLASYWQL